VEANNLTESSAVIFAGGEMHTAPSPPFDAYVIAADSGYDHALNHGVAVDLLVGDLDSISPEGLDHATQKGVPIEKHPPDKDATDLELAFSAAINRDCTSIDLYGGEGGELAHLFGIASLLTSRLVRGASVTWHTATSLTRPLVGNSVVSVVGSVGAKVSIVAIADSAGVTTSGLTWSLAGETLSRGTSRGLHNTMTGNSASISIGSGAVLVISEGTNTP
jgi:thiamine pyrophosphokinase